MEVKIINETRNRLEIEIPKEDHTLGNYLRTALLADPKVKHACYQKVHPLTGGITLVIQTDEGASPRKALDGALARMEKESGEFREKLKKAMD